MTLEPWKQGTGGRAITAGEDLPFEKESLGLYCPHSRKNCKLTTQWRLKCDTRFYYIKMNTVVINHLQ
eukprot:11068384-Ditylum_brightwellii.AAC.1